MRCAKSSVLSAALACAALVSQGCRSADGVRMGRPTSKGAIRNVACLYDPKPWISVDKAGDRDPEGVQYRVFLDPGTGRGVLRDGVLHIEMYQIDAKPEGGGRTLVSDWIYPTKDIPPIRSNVLGMGYHLRLRWAKKAMVGHEVELVTRFEDAEGNTIATAGTKRLRVPKTGR